MIRLVSIGKLFLMLVALGCAAEPLRVPVPADARMLFWERQSWEPGGGSSRLTLWADGRSEVIVAPGDQMRGSYERLRPREGWTVNRASGGVRFVRDQIYPEQIAREKFRMAFEAGMHLLESFPPDYLDGSGTLVGVQIGDDLKQTTIPMFLDSRQGTPNHMRFLTVAEILGDFDDHAYDLEQP